MLDIWLGSILLLALIAVIVALLQYRRNVTVDLPRIQQQFEALEKSHQNLAQSVREELAKSREEAAARSLETNKALKSTADTLNQSVDRVRETVEQKLEVAQEESAKKLAQLQEESAASAKSLREEIEKAIKSIQESLSKNAGEAGQARKAQLEALSAKLAESVAATGQKIDGVKAAVEAGLKAVQGDSAKQLEQTRTAVQEKLQLTEKRVGDSVQQIAGRLDQISKEVQALAVNIGNISNHS